MKKHITGPVAFTLCINGSTVPATFQVTGSAINGSGCYTFLAPGVMPSPFYFGDTITFTTTGLPEGASIAAFKLMTCREKVTKNAHDSPFGTLGNTDPIDLLAQGNKTIIREVHEEGAWPFVILLRVQTVSGSVTTFTDYWIDPETDVNTGQR